MILTMTKSKINTSIFCFLKKQDARNTLSDTSCSGAESLLVLWDDERAAKFAAAESKKYEKALKQGKRFV